jgi:nitrate/nitrite transporter NarK
LSLVYAGVQLAFISFMVAYLTEEAAWPIVTAGLGLATYQVAGVAARVGWGWLADRFGGPRLMLAAMGFIMAVAAVLTGMFTPDWPVIAVLAVCAVAGGTASGFTGLAYAEYARIAGPGRTAEATGAGAFMMFFGCMALPATFSLIVRFTGSYALAYDFLAALAAMSGTVMLLPLRAAERRLP